MVDAREGQRKLDEISKNSVDSNDDEILPLNKKTEVAPKVDQFRTAKDQQKLYESYAKDNNKSLKLTEKGKISERKEGKQNFINISKSTSVTNENSDLDMEFSSNEKPRQCEKEKGSTKDDERPTTASEFAKTVDLYLQIQEVKSHFQKCLSEERAKLKNSTENIFKPIESIDLNESGTKIIGNLSERNGHSTVNRRQALVFRNSGVDFDLYTGYRSDKNFLSANHQNNNDNTIRKKFRRKLSCISEKSVEHLNENKEVLPTSTSCPSTTRCSAKKVRHFRRKPLPNQFLENFNFKNISDVRRKQGKKEEKNYVCAERNYHRKQCQENRNDFDKKPPTSGSTSLNASKMAFNEVYNTARKYSKEMRNTEYLSNSVRKNSAVNRELADFINLHVKRRPPWDSSPLRENELDRIAPIRTFLNLPGSSNSRPVKTFSRVTRSLVNSPKHRSLSLTKPGKSSSLLNFAAGKSGLLFTQRPPSISNLDPLIKENLWWGHKSAIS